MLCKKISLIICLCLIFLSPFLLKAANDPVLLKVNAIIHTSAKPGEPLYLAVLNLQRDMKKVLGKSTTLQTLDNITAPGIVIATADKDNLAKTVAGWESHHLYIGSIDKTQQLILEGADTRGSIYAIYTFCEQVLGVPPLWYYSEWQPTPIDITVTAKEVAELRNKILLTDIFTKKKTTHDGGDLKVVLAPYASQCLLL